MAPGAQTFAAAPETYDRHVGRYTPALARSHVRLLDLGRRSHVLEVGCGPGALTEALAGSVGGRRVSAVEPSEAFAEACRARVPDADVRVGAAEDLPDFGREFDAATSQLVLDFMSDADAGVASMTGAVGDGGVVASVVWDYRAGMRMLRAFWDAALELDRGAPDEARTSAHCTPAGLRALYDWYERNAGLVACVLRDAEYHALTREITELRFGKPMALFHEVLGARLKAKQRALLPLTLSFHTWRTLTRESGLKQNAAVAAMVQAIACAGEESKAR